MRVSRPHHPTEKEEPKKPEEKEEEAAQRFDDSHETFDIPVMFWQLSFIWP